MFTASNMLNKYLKAQPKDMYDIIGALIGYINADPYFETDDFDEAIKYVLSNGVTETELYQDFNAEIYFEENAINWDEDYYSYARVYLKDNFCKKRIQHVKKVAHKLHPVMQASSVPQKSPISIPNRDEKDKPVTQNVTEINEETRGGQQKTGKKNQDHQKNHTTTQKSVATKGLVICGVIILVGAIVYIINKML